MGLEIMVPLFSSEQVLGVWLGVSSRNLHMVYVWIFHGDTNGYNEGTTNDMDDIITNYCILLFLPHKAFNGATLVIKCDKLVCNPI